MERILNIETELDTNLFDQIVLNSNDPSSKDKNESEEILLKFKSLNNSWTKVDDILKRSKVQQSHYVALQILEETVKAKWYVFDDNIKQGIREYVFQLVIEKSRTKDCENYVMQELNRILVEMAKRDWPKRWSNFVSDLINVSTTISMDVCRNTLEILKKLNEDVFLKGDDRITTVRNRLLRNQMKKEFPVIFNFIKMILEYSEKNDVDDSLLEATLSTFTCFCNSIPLEYIFKTNIVELICEHINSSHSISCLICLIEIIDLGRSKERFVNVDLTIANEQKILYIFNKSLEFFEMYLNKFKTEKIFEVYNNMENAEKNFILKLSQLFAAMMEIYMHKLEENNIHNTKKCLEHLVIITRINDNNIFLVLFEMWNKIVFDLYTEFPFNNKDSKKKLRRSDYIGVLNHLLNSLVEKMPRPEEVFIVVNEYGDVIKNKMIETDQIEFYKKMKSCLYHLAFLIEDDMKNYFIQKVGLQLRDKEWGWNNINRLCWSIGCISGAFDEESERDFFVTILRYLLGLCEMKHCKADKAVIASNIMFIIGQFHRFLLHNKSFLKTVIKKLFEFMDEEHEGIKDMACDNFYKITERCPREFLIQREEKTVLLAYILENLKKITSTLEFYQKRSVYEALLIVIREIPQEQSNHELILKYIDTIFSSISDVNIFTDEYTNSLPSAISSLATIKTITHVIKSHALVYKFIPMVCESSYTSLFPYYFRLYDVCNGIMLMGNNASSVTNAKAAKSNIVELFKEVIEAKFIKEEFITQLCEKIIFDYKNNSKCKDPLIILLANSIIQNIPRNNSIQYLQIETFFISSIIEPSIPYIMKADKNPEIAVNYLRLIETFLTESFNSFYSNIYNNNSFNLIYNSFLYSLVCLREISDIALNILTIMFKACYENNQQQFFIQNFMITLENLLGIIFDRDMKYNFNLQCSLLALMFRISKDISSLDGTNSNISILSNYILNLFTQNFPNITQESLKIFISGLFELSRNDEVFKAHLEDFAVKIYEFGNDEDIEEEIALKNERIRLCQE